VFAAATQSGSIISVLIAFKIATKQERSPMQQPASVPQPTTSLMRLSRPVSATVIQSGAITFASTAQKTQIKQDYLQV
jgi:hypothetical protein